MTAAILIGRNGRVWQERVFVEPSASKVTWAFVVEWRPATMPPTSDAQGVDFVTVAFHRTSQEINGATVFRAEQDVPIE